MELSSAQFKKQVTNSLTNEEFLNAAEAICTDCAGRPEELLLRAVVAFLCLEAQPADQNLASIFKLVCCDSDRWMFEKNFPDYFTPLGIIFNDLEKEKPDHIAVKYYAEYRTALLQEHKRLSEKHDQT